MTADDFYACLHCRQPVRHLHLDDGGDVWVHLDGYQQCRSTWASPNFGITMRADGTVTWERWRDSLKGEQP